MLCPAAQSHVTTDSTNQSDPFSALQLYDGFKQQRSKAVSGFGFTVDKIKSITAFTFKIKDLKDVRGKGLLMIAGCSSLCFDLTAFAGAG